MDAPWEVARIDWGQLRSADRANSVANAIHQLVTAESPEEADRAFWRLDNNVVRQGSLYEAALPTTRCLLSSLLRATAISRPYILEFLVELGSGSSDPSEISVGLRELGEQCIQEIARASSVLFELLEIGSLDEQLSCIDLLGLCALRDTALRDRFVWYLQRFEQVSSPTRPNAFVQNWLQELRERP